MPKMTLIFQFGSISGICTCQPRLQTSHCPDGKIADVLALTNFCTTAAGALVNYRMYVPQRPWKISHRPPWETHVLLVVCRAAVLLSMEAQWPSHGAPSVGTQLA
jgi:hypothetical protein